MRAVAGNGIGECHGSNSPNILRHCEERSDEAIQTCGVALDCFAALAITAWQLPSVQLLDRHRHAPADADAHRCQRAYPPALLHAVQRRHRQPRAAHPEGMTECDGAAMRVDEIGVFLDAELAQAGYALAGARLREL